MDVEKLVISKEIAQEGVDQEADLHQEETDTEAEGIRVEVHPHHQAEEMREADQDKAEQNKAKAEVRAGIKVIREPLEIRMTKKIKAN